MKRLIQIFLLVNFLTAHADSGFKNLTVTSVYQIDDERNASFDFFTTEVIHKCGGKPSNRFRSYSRYAEVADRKFILVTEALTQHLTLGVRLLDCEGNAMRVDSIGLHH